MSVKYRDRHAIVALRYQNRKERNRRERKAEITHTLSVSFPLHGEMSEELIMIFA
jgi:hypothetical protein